MKTWIKQLVKEAISELELSHLLSVINRLEASASKDEANLRAEVTKIVSELKSL
jgi:hypothetical protein